MLFDIPIRNRIAKLSLVAAACWLGLALMAQAAQTTLFSATFDQDAEGFAFSDERAVSGLYPIQDGGWGAAAGQSGGGLEVSSEFRSFGDTSYAWSAADEIINSAFARDFTLTETAAIILTFRYKIHTDLIISAPVYLLRKVTPSVNGFELGSEDYSLSEADLFSLGGNGDCDTYCVNLSDNTGWVQVEIDLGILSAGTHELKLNTVLGFDSYLPSPWTDPVGSFTVAFDDVVLTADTDSAVIVDTPVGTVYTDGDLFGATPGKLGVTPSGNSVYSVPVVVPTGTAGVQPALSLEYNSSGRDGVLGTGWSLGGLSAIARCSATKAHDGFADPVDYDGDDRFCLNGARLVPVSGTYGADGTEYRTSFEQFSKIISYGTAGTGPERFRVWTRSGEILDFGNTDDSRIEALNRPDIRVWALNRLEDRSGNHIAWSYFEDTSTGEYGIERIDYTGNDLQGLVPQSSVVFAYEDGQRVQFEQDLEWVNAPAAYHAGAPYRRTRRLASITANRGTDLFRKYTLDYSIHGLDYDFDEYYLQSVTECLPSACLDPTVLTWTDHFEGDYDDVFTETSLGTAGIPDTSLDEYRVAASGDFNGDGLTDLFLHKADTDGRKTGSSNSDRVFLSDGSGSFTTVAIPSADSLADDERVVTSGDFNGDGLTDLFVYNADTDDRKDGSASQDYVWLSAGDGTFNAVATATNLADDYTLGASGDFDRDGLTDLYFFKADAQGRATGDVADTVWTSSGDGTFNVVAFNASEGVPGSSYANHMPLAAGDFNGDGVLDLFWVKTDSYRRISGDPNQYLWLGDGDGTWTQTTLGTGGTLAGTSFGNYAPVATGDFNGDGITDMNFGRLDGYGRGASNPSGGGSWPSYTGYTYYGKGDGSFQVERYGYSLHYCQRVSGVGDYNGDGRADLYVMTVTTSNVYVANNESGCPRAYTNTHWDTSGLETGNAAVPDDQSAGRGGNARTFTATYMPHHTGYHMAATGDFNGDGLSDIYALKTDAYGRSTGAADDMLLISNWNTAKRIKRIENGMGLVSEIDYAPMSDASVYTKGSGASYPVYDVTSSRYLVSAVRTDDGIGGQNQQSYAYEQLRAEVDTGSLGFARMTVTDDATGIVMEAEYSQDHTNDTQGLLVSSKTIAPGSVATDETTNTWGVTRSTTTDNSPLLFRHVSSTTSTKRDLDGTLMSTATTATTYNDYGFPTQVTATVTGDGNTYTKVTDNTYGADDGASWLIGRVTAASLTNSASGTANIVRSSAFTYDATTGQLLSETIEPGDALSHTSTYVRNGFGHRDLGIDRYGRHNRHQPRLVIHL